MQILIYGLNYRPELVGVGKYTSEMAEWLVDRGHQVSVVTAPPHYPEWKVGSGYRGSRGSIETLAGVRVVRCPMWLPRHYSTLKRIASVISFALSSFLPLLREARRRRPDWLIVIEPSFFSVPGAWIVARLLRLPLWLHVQDFELGAASKLGIVRGGIALRFAAAIEAWFLRRPDRVSTLSGPMMQQLAHAGVREERQVLMPNWVNCQDIYPTELPSPYRAELGFAPDDIVCLYSGSFGRKHGLGLVVEAARRLQSDPRFQFVLCGEGSERKRLQAAAQDVTNLRWLPLQPRERLNDLLNLADVHLLPQRGSVAADVLPSKLTGMLASGRPVIATVSPGTPIAQIVSQCGAIVPPGDADAFAQALVALTRDPSHLSDLGAAARNYAVMNYDRDGILYAFEHRLFRTPD